MKKTVWTILISATLAIVLTAGAFWGVGQFRTVDQQTAEAAPPTPSILTAQVGESQLARTLAVTCAPGFRATYPVVHGAALGTSVLTSMPVKQGDAVAEGTLLATINGQPLLALTGEFPLYRDLKKGDVGPDATMINGFLIRMGYLYGEAADTFTSDSVWAMRAYLNDLGFPQAKKEDWELSKSTFSVIPTQGTVVDAPVKTGLLQSEGLFTVGLGTSGLRCGAGKDGGVPSVVKEGQSLTAPGLGLTKAVKIQIVGRAATAQAQGNDAGPGAAGLPGGAVTPVNNRIAFAELPEGVTAAATEATISIDQAPGSSLTVPISALWTKDGQTTVTRVDQAGDQVDIIVAVTFTANGMNAITVAEGSPALAKGDAVLIGKAN